MAQSIFRKESLDRVNSPEQLNDYIKTSNPSAWFIVIAAIILLVAVIVWGVFGSLDNTVSINGVADGSTVTCFTASVGDIKVGDKVNVGELTGEVLSVSEKPISMTQAQEQLNTDEYTLYCLDLSDWNYVVEISVPDNTESGFVTADITTQSIKPITFLLG